MMIAPSANSQLYRLKYTLGAALGGGGVRNLGGTRPTAAAQQTVHPLQGIAFGQAKTYRLFQAFQAATTGTSEMKMVAGHFFVPASPTKGKILFAVIGHHPMGQAILTKLVEYPINGRPIGLQVHLSGNGFLAQGPGRAGQQLKNGRFGRGVPSFCHFLMQLCCNNK